MSLERLRQTHIIGAAAYAMGSYIQQHTPAASPSAGILCALSMQALNNGHTCLDCQNVVLQFPALSQLPELLTDIEPDSLSIHPLIGLDKLMDGTLFTYCPPYLFTNKFFALESRLIQQVASRLSHEQASAETSKPLQLAELCFIKPLTVLSGGPGTGKTTVFAQALPHWIQRFQSAHNQTPRIILCAPTGKAAARMSESWAGQKQVLEADSQYSDIYPALPEQAVTIHRLLAIHPISRHAGFHEDNLLPVDLLIIDEASMLDLPLFVKLLEATPQHAHVLLIGDQQQLPAIEAGRILGSLLDTNSKHWFFQQLQSAHLHLTHNYRQQQSPGLAKIAEHCLDQPAQVLISNLSSHAYPHVVWSDDSQKAHSDLIDHAASKYLAICSCDTVEQALTNIRSFMVLTAVRDGPNGCIAINDEISRRLNPSQQAYYHGQILLITENAEHLQLANGDIAIVWQQEQTLNAYYLFNATTRCIALDSLPKHESGYALTIHKAQGSEYNDVSIVLPAYDSAVLSKALLYTGITRAKRNLHILAKPDTLTVCLSAASIRANGLQLLAERLVQDEIQ